MLDNDRTSPSSRWSPTTRSPTTSACLDQSDIQGRLHHVAYWVDAREDLLRAADILLGAESRSSSARAATGWASRTTSTSASPGGVRLEINTGGYRNYVPDWEPTNGSRRRARTPSIATSAARTR